LEDGTGGTRLPCESTAGEASAGEVGADPPPPVSPEIFLTNFLGMNRDEGVGNEKPAEAFGVASDSVGTPIGVGKLP